jgi:hypothetical protein
VLTEYCGQKKDERKTNNDLKQLHRKLHNEHQELHKNQRTNSEAPEGRNETVQNTS